MEPENEMRINDAINGCTIIIKREAITSFLSGGADAPEPREGKPTEIRDAELQAAADQLAVERKSAGERSMTKREAARFLSKNPKFNALTPERIERIILKTW